MADIILIYDDTTFRTTFPAFANLQVYPETVLQMYWDWATSYMSDVSYGWLQGVDRQLGLYQLTAHLGALMDTTNNGQNTGLLQASTIDKVSVTFTPPPIPNQWQWWLNQTPYGQMLLALLEVNSVGGFYEGGAPVRAGFRNAVGGFG